MSSKLHELSGPVRNTPYASAFLFMPDAFNLRCPLGQESRRFGAFAPQHGTGKLRDFFRTRFQNAHPNGARYDSYYQPHSIEKAFLSCTAV